MIRKFLGRVKRQLLDKPAIKNPRHPTYWFDRILGDAPASLVQIGSNDGKTEDPLYPLFQKHPTWTGLLVEPVPYVFQRLEANYPDRARFQLANLAINEGVPLPFYYVDQEALKALPDLPNWYDQLGSFNRSHIVGELAGVLEPYIRELEVEGVTLAALLSRYGVAEMEVLHIDAESYDWKILSQLDLTAYAPIFILFESNHLNEAERAAAINFLTGDYELFQLKIDILAVSRKVSPKQRKKMHRYLKAITK